MNISKLNQDKDEFGLAEELTEIIKSDNIAQLSDKEANEINANISFDYHNTRRAKFLGERLIYANHKALNFHSFNYKGYDGTIYRLERNLRAIVSALIFEPLSVSPTNLYALTKYELSQIGKFVHKNIQISTIPAITPLIYSLFKRDTDRLMPVFATPFILPSPIKGKMNEYILLVPILGYDLAIVNLYSAFISDIKQINSIKQKLIKLSLTFQNFKLLVTDFEKSIFNLNKESGIAIYTPKNFNTAKLEVLQIKDTKIETIFKQKHELQLFFQQLMPIFSKTLSQTNFKNFLPLISLTFNEINEIKRTGKFFSIFETWEALKHTKMFSAGNYFVMEHIDKRLYEVATLKNTELPCFAYTLKSEFSFTPKAKQTKKI